MNNTAEWKLLLAYRVQSIQCTDDVPYDVGFHRHALNLMDEPHDALESLRHALYIFECASPKEGVKLPGAQSTA